MMSRNLPYRKYRPVVQPHRNAHIWSENVWALILQCHSLTKSHMAFYHICMCWYTLQVEVCDHKHSGGWCKASAPHVVMAAHSPSPADGKMLQRAVQDQNHQQETKWGAAQRTRGGTGQNPNTFQHLSLSFILQFFSLQLVKDMSPHFCLIIQKKIKQMHRWQIVPVHDSSYDEI